MFERHYASLLLVADVVRDGAVVVPVFPKRSAILTGMPLWLPGKLFKAGRYRIAGVFLVEHRGHVVGTTGISGGVVDGHGSGHGHVNWGSDVDG